MSPPRAGESALTAPSLRSARRSSCEIARSPQTERHRREIVPSHCQRPRRGHYERGAPAYLTPKPDNVGRVSCWVSSRSGDITQYVTS
jgi:hypothetical protein